MKSLIVFSESALGVRQSGQAMVEYILMLVVAISLVAALGSSFRRAITGIWGYYTQQITSACPTGCPPNVKYRFR